MTRRLLLALPLAAPLFAADASEQAYELAASAASYLSSGNAEGFVDLLDRSMPGYEEFTTQVRGLLLQTEVQSSVVVLRNEGDEAARALELDWFLQLRARDDTASVLRRREVVKCQVRKAGRKWKFFTFSPQTLFAPPKPR
jgi:hypothetical protein